MKYSKTKWTFVPYTILLQPSIKKVKFKQNIESTYYEFHLFNTRIIFDRKLFTEKVRDFWQY